MFYLYCYGHSRRVSDTNTPKYQYIISIKGVTPNHKDPTLWCYVQYMNPLYNEKILYTFTWNYD